MIRALKERKNNSVALSGLESGWHLTGRFTSGYFLVTAHAAKFLLLSLIFKEHKQTAIYILQLIFYTFLMPVLHWKPEAEANTA